MLYENGLSIILKKIYPNRYNIPLWCNGNISDFDPDDYRFDPCGGNNKK